MTTIVTQLKIEQGKISLELAVPTDIADGWHEAVLHIKEPISTHSPIKKSILDEIELVSDSSWSLGSTFSREEIYNVEGR